jgi:hypothetical protein
MLSKQKLFAWTAIIIVVVLVFFWWNRSQDSAQSSGGVAVSTLDWKEFNPNNGKFTVFLPTLPQHASDAVPLPSGLGFIKYDMYLSQERDGTVFMISMIQYPNDYDTANAQMLLENVMKELMGGNVHNKLKTSQKGMYKDLPCLDFLIENNEILIRSKAFIMSKTLFVLTLIDKTPADVEEHFKRYFEAFHLSETNPAQMSVQLPGEMQQVQPK